MAKSLPSAGVEQFFDDNEIIVSKTDLKGRLTYCNNVFLSIAGYTEQECLGQQHSMIRHPDMPRCIFKLLWDTLKDEKEIFAYVKNRCKNGDYYWVYAHVTPSYDVSGKVVGYHSNRRVPDPVIIKDIVIPLYASLKSAEDQAENRKQGLATSQKMIDDMLAERGIAYDEWILTLGRNKKELAA